MENVGNLAKHTIFHFHEHKYQSQTGLAVGCPRHPPIFVCVLTLREEASCWVSVEQSPFVLGLTGENGELLLDERVQVTEGSKTKERHLFLFSDVIVFAKLK